MPNTVAQTAAVLISDEETAELNIINASAMTTVSPTATKPNTMAPHADILTSDEEKADWMLLDYLS
jgi:hypothetical protein